MSEFGKILLDDGQPFRAVNNYLLETYTYFKENKDPDDDLYDFDSFSQFIRFIIAHSLDSLTTTIRLETEDELEEA